MDDLLRKLSREECLETAFADDLAIVVEADSRSDLERLGMNALRLASEWGGRVCVPISTRKTECMLLKGKLSVNRPPCIKLNGRGIPYAKSVKYLGITFGEGMNFRPHFLKMRSKMLCCVSGFRRILKKEWGLDRGSFGVIYNGLFVACMSYGAGVWYDCLKSDHMRALINRCQRVVLHASLNVCRTVSTEAMQVLHGQLPWDLECVLRGTLSRFRRGIALAEGSPVTSDELVRLSRKQKTQLISTKLFDTWQSRWECSAKGRQTFRFIRNVRFASGHRGFSPGLHLSYLLTGHGSMGEFLHKRGLSVSEACLCGAPVESVDHLISECSLYGDIRDLDAFGVSVDPRGNLEVGAVLNAKETYDRLNDFAVAVFTRRSRLVNAT